LYLRIEPCKDYMHTIHNRYTVHLVHNMYTIHKK